jgi:hypothetical protein
MRQNDRKAPVDNVDAQITVAQAALDAHCQLMCELPADQREAAVTKLVVLTDAVIARRFERSEIIRNHFVATDKGFRRGAR